MYDLLPASLSARNLYLNLQLGNTISELSPAQHINNIHAPIVLGHGTKETPEFQRQSREFYAAVKAAGKAVTLLVGTGYNHYETQETLGNPYGFMGRPALQMAGLRV